MRQDGDDFFGTGMMVEVLRHVGTTAWLRDVLKMSVKTSVSSPAQSLSARLGMLSDPGALRTLILLKDLLMLSGDSVRTWSPRGCGVFCSGLLLCASKRAKNSLWRWLVVRYGLYPLPHRVSLLSLKCCAIFLEYCLLASLIPRDRFALAVLRPTSSLASFLTFSSL